MKILIFYFSGTGNTQKIAEKYREAFEAEGVAVTLGTLPEITNELPHIDFGAYDLLGFGYPIHAFNAPANVLALAKQLPRLNAPKNAFVFKSSGEPVRMSDVSSLKLIKLLTKRNINVTNEYQYCMPYNIIFRHSDAMAYKMWTTAQALIPVDVREILRGKPSLPDGMFLGGVPAWTLRAEHWGAHLIGKGFKTTDKCIKCGLCIKNCPTQNITVTEKGTYKFGKNCMICMRCVFNCPKDAIKPGILKSWKVNGAYSLQPPPADMPQDDEHAAYCKKAYDRYFAAAEQKIRAAQDGNGTDAPTQAVTVPETK